MRGNTVDRDIVCGSRNVVPSPRVAQVTCGRGGHVRAMTIRIGGRQVITVIDVLISQDTGHLVRSCVRILRATADSVPFNPSECAA